MSGRTAFAETGYNHKRVSNIAMMPMHIVTVESGNGRRPFFIIGRGT
jgi:hypothetical protein